MGPRKQAPTSGVARHPRSGPRVSRLNRASGGATSELDPFEAKAQAARRLRLTPDALDERERRLATEGDCLRFRRNFTGAAAGGDCGGATGDHSACSIAGAGGVVTTPRGSRRLFTLPRPKASLNIAPYQSTTAPATVVGAVARGNGVREASGEGVTSAGSLVARSSRDDSRCFGDPMTSTPMTHSRSTRDRHFVLVYSNSLTLVPKQCRSSAIHRRRHTGHLDRQPDGLPALIAPCFCLAPSDLRRRSSSRFSRRPL
jgi:hypothetical protein